jgi:hypothetical protein
MLYSICDMSSPGGTTFDSESPKTARQGVGATDGSGRRVRHRPAARAARERPTDVGSRKECRTMNHRTLKSCIFTLILPVTGTAACDTDASRSCLHPAWRCGASMASSRDLRPRTRVVFVHRSCPRPRLAARFPSHPGAPGADGEWSPRHPPWSTPNATPERPARCGAQRSNQRPGSSSRASKGGRRTSPAPTALAAMIQRSPSPSKTSTSSVRGSTIHTQGTPALR